MPELPEVETIRRQLEPLLLGRKCVEAESHWHQKFLPAREIVGCEFLNLTRKGKYLICELAEEVDGARGKATKKVGKAQKAGKTKKTDNGDRRRRGDGHRDLVIHLGMTGSLIVKDTDAAATKYLPELISSSQSSLPKSASDSLSHIRARWWLDDHTQLVFNDIRRFGRLRVVPRGDYSSAPTLARQGPDALSPEFTPKVLHARLLQSTRTLKTQLLSQRPVAGLGNIYADEALWEAGIHPARRNLSPARCETLHRAIRDVLDKALEAGGTTLRDYRTPDSSTGSFQYRLNCYGQAGHPCPSCHSTLRKQAIDARTTTWCPSCQR